MIDQLHWDLCTVSACIPPTDDVTNSKTRMWLAIWPSPINPDACFQAAGFERFEDTDDAWDKAWRCIIQSTLAALSTPTDPVIRKPVVAMKIGRSRPLGFITGRPKRADPVPLPLAEQIELATADDQFGRAVVDFGADRAVTLMAGYGHPLIWLTARGGTPLFERELKEGWLFARPFTRFPLRCNCLGPPVI